MSRLLRVELWHFDWLQQKGETRSDSETARVACNSTLVLIYFR